MKRRLSDMQARKELLLARSSIERMELGAHLHQIREAIKPANVLKSVWPGSRGGGSGGGVATAMQAWRLLRRYPIVSSAAPMLLARVRPRGIFRLFKVGGIAFAAYQAFKFWQGIQENGQERRRDADPR